MNVESMINKTIYTPIGRFSIPRLKSRLKGFYASSDAWGVAGFLHASGRDSSNVAFGHATHDRYGCLLAKPIPVTLAIIGSRIHVRSNTITGAFLGDFELKEIVISKAQTGTVKQSNQIELQFALPA